MKITTILLFSVLCLCGVFSQESATQQQKKAEARKLYNEALQFAMDGDYPVAFSKINNALLRNPGFEAAILMRARLSFQLNNDENALDDIKQILQQNPNHGEAKFLKGFILMHTDPTYHDSILFLEALEDGYQRPDVYYQLGLLYLDIRQYKKAKDYLAKAIEIKPDYALALNDMGTAHYELNDFEGAIHHYQKAIEAQPDFIDAHNNLGTARKGSGDFEGAINAYTTAIERDSTYYAAYNNRGAVYMDLKETDKAHDDFNKALDLQDSYAAALCNLGIMATRNNDFKKAMEYFNRALAADPEHGASYLNRGLAYEIQGNVTKACTDWQEALHYGEEIARKYLEDCN